MVAGDVMNESQKEMWAWKGWLWAGLSGEQYAVE